MQINVYYGVRDRHLIERLTNKAKAERRSASAEVLRIIEQYFRVEDTTVKTESRKGMGGDGNGQ